MNIHETDLSELEQCSNPRNNINCGLENKVENLENKLDGYEQYSSRSNLRFLGIEEIVSDDQLEGTVIDIINKQMCLYTAPGRRYRLELQSRSEAPDISLSPRAREISKRTSPRRRRVPTKVVFVNEDLTARRARLAYDARYLRKLGTILDTWTYNGTILAKDRENKIFVVSTKPDFPSK